LLVILSPALRGEGPCGWFFPACHPERSQNPIVILSEDEQRYVVDSIAAFYS
jgi:hypothetical protein